MDMQYYVRADLVNGLLDMKDGTVNKVAIDEHMVYDAIMSFGAEAMTIEVAFEQIKKAFGRK